MITLVLGLILLAIPFVLMNLFSDKKRGFIYVFFFLLLFQTVLAIFTQFFWVFYYNVVVGCTLFADVVLFFVYFRIKKNLKQGLEQEIKGGFSLPGQIGLRLKFATLAKLFDRVKFNSIDWVIIAVAIISSLSFYQVHYNYTGGISIATDQIASYHEVDNMVYPYPYFSDEWYAVSLVEGAIDNHSLPIINPLNNSFFLNLELFFHSFIAEIMLFLGLNPLLHYTILSIFCSTLIIILAYLFLRINNISKLTSGVCSLLMLYITCGANLPGLWHLIPFSLGIMFALLSLCFMEFGDIKTVLLSIFFSCLFYPPLIPFYFIGLTVFLLCKIRAPKEYLFKVISRTLLFLFLALPTLYILLMLSPLADTVSYIFSRIFFASFLAPYLPKLDFYNIIPMPAILLVAFGLYSIYKNKKWILLSEFALGVVMWFFYSSTVYRFFAEYERVVILTSIMVVIISGFGLRQLEFYIIEKFEKNGQKLIKMAEVAVLAVFVILVPFYTQGENWKKITTLDSMGREVYYPKSPANYYLTGDDLIIFKDIKNKRFLSIPWKGTVIGVATGNYPVLTKQGTISIGSNNILNDFLKSGCKGKEDIARKFNLDYVYIYEFNCLKFPKLDKSQEGLVLYKVE